ncbi:MAG: hypothetical protein HZA20_02890 [Nitrospirae bacterium]|nr:hypothetical protein [Nitrospirota bacterium]
MSVIAIPRHLREKLGDDATDAFVSVVREIDFEARKDTLAIAEERFERRLAEEIGKLRAELIKWMFIFWCGQIGVIFALLKLVR